MKGSDLQRLYECNAKHSYIENNGLRDYSTILHKIFECQDEIPHIWMKRFILKFYVCAVVMDDEGDIPLHVAVRHNINPEYIRMLMLLSPFRVEAIRNNHGVSSISGAASCLDRPEDKETLHALMDFYRHSRFQDDHIGIATSMAHARSRCKSIARIFIRRRLIARNRDVSWLVALEIWTTRTDSAWE